MPRCKLAPGHAAGINCRQTRRHKCCSESWFVAAKFVYKLCPRRAVPWSATRPARFQYILGVACMKLVGSAEHGLRETFEGQGGCGKRFGFSGAPPPVLRTASKVHRKAPPFFNKRFPQQTVSAPQKRRKLVVSGCGQLLRKTFWGFAESLLGFAARLWGGAENVGSSGETGSFLQTSSGPPTSLPQTVFGRAQKCSATCSTEENVYVRPLNR